MVGKFGVEELDRPAESLDLNPFEHLWDEVEPRLRAWPFEPDLTKALLDEFKKIEFVKIPTETLQNIVESLSGRMEAFIWATNSILMPCI